MRVLLAGVLVLLLAGPTTAQQRFGAFTFERAADAITDADRSRVWTSALEPTATRNAQLVWRCNGVSDIELFLAADEFLNSRASASVIWRFDREQASERQRWPVSTNGTAAFAPQEVIPAFSDAARAANQLVVRVADYRGVEYDSRFAMSGVTAALQRLPCFAAIAKITADIEKARRDAEEAAQLEAERREAARIERAREAAERATRQQQRGDSLAAVLRDVIAKADSLPWAAAPTGKYFYPTATYLCWRSVAGPADELVFFRTLEEAMGSGRTQATGCRS
ncbi:MAG: hypothetical protein AMXMBFR53_26490 [Gemmatimonadota bacterium]